MNKKYPRVVIAGTNSGVGKTTVVTGLLAALRQKGIRVQPFKIGPDYIDPGFHTKAAGAESYNLDTWLVPEKRLAENFAFLAGSAEISVIEGVMGLYDGGAKGISSTAEIAKKLQAPVVLVINAKSMGQSAGAIAMGYRDYDPELNLAGVILNRVGSLRHAEMTKESIEKIGIPVLGVIHRNDDLQTPERHLGLTPVTEMDPTQRIEYMRETITKSVDLEKVMRVASAASELNFIVSEDSPERYNVRIGIAKDEAFSFYYPTGIAYLEKMGAEIIPFSPLNDENLPHVDALIFGGGFPEMFLDKLAQNTVLKEKIRNVAKNGMPIYAECGGLLYLSHEIIDFGGVSYPMVGLVPASAKMETKLQRVGYVEASAQRESIFCRKGDVLRGHEFHFSSLTTKHDFPWAYRLQGSRQSESHLEGYAVGNVLASYLHLAFDGNESATKRFLSIVEKYRREHNA